MEDNSALEVGNVVDELRVLAIDAQVYSLQFLCVVLHKCKYKVKTTSSAAEALEILKANKDEFDVVLVDVDSVSMDGFKLLEIIGLEMYSPVIMVTEDGSLDNIRKGLMHGAVDYVLKPVGLQEINTSIWRAVTLNRTKGSEQSTHSEEDDDENQKPLLVDASCGVKKKKRMIWTPELDAKFVKAVQQLSKDSMVHPKRILKIMNEPGLTRGNIASHLQKYRDSLKKNNAGKKEQGFHVGSSSCRRISNLRKRGAKSDRLPVHQLSKFQDMNSNFSDARMTTLSPYGGLNSTNSFQSLLCCSLESPKLHMQNFQSFLGSDPLSETTSGSAYFHEDSYYGITVSEPDTALQRSNLVGASDVPHLFPGFTGLTRNVSETDLGSSVVENSHNDPISTDVDNIVETELKLLDDEDLISLWQLLNSD